MQRHLNKLNLAPFICIDSIDMADILKNEIIYVSHIMLIVNTLTEQMFKCQCDFVFLKKL